MAPIYLQYRILKSLYMASQHTKILILATMPLGPANSIYSDYFRISFLNNHKWATPFDSIRQLEIDLTFYTRRSA